MFRMLTFAVAAVIVTACGYSTQDRALSGAAIGAAAGAAGGALVDGGTGALAGALIGGAAGAAAGGFTDADDINLGDPVW